jgi:HPt (histidine-containing phosphotransfer) domain-containing protein
MDAFVTKPFTPQKVGDALRFVGSAPRTSLPAAGPPSAEVAASPDTSRSELNLEMLEFLADDSTGGLDGSIDRYCAEMERLREAARTAIEQGRPTDIGQAAHKLVTHARGVGADKLADLALGLQGSAAMPAAEVRHWFDEFEHEFERVRYILASIRGAKGPG